MTKFVPTALAAAAIGFSALMTLGAPTAYASEKSDCEGKGGTYTQTTITNQTTGKIGTRHSCCVKDAKTNTTTCTSTTVTNASRVPDNVGPELIEFAETAEPALPGYRVPLAVLGGEAQIEQTP